jgi:hypothetical protein
MSLILGGGEVYSEKMVIASSSDSWKMQLVDKRRCNADEKEIGRLILRNSASCSRDDKYSSVPYISIQSSLNKLIEEKKIWPLHI